MDRFKQYVQLDEKLILLSNGKNYGQIVFLAGGAASGKGFAAQNFMEKNKFKVRNVDEWKEAFLKMANLKDDPEKWAKMQSSGTNIDPEKYKEIKNLKLTVPGDVIKFHQFVQDLGIKDKTLDLMIKQMKNPETLPNIMFDITAKNINDIGKFMPKLLTAGYNPADIHIVWVLTDYKIALSNNLDPKRGRVLPEDILLQTHKGAAQTMFDYVNGVGRKLAINGQIHVVLNNRENTVYYGAGKKLERISAITGKKNDGVIKDFKYLTLKKRGKSPLPEKKITQQLYGWIVDNIPTGDLLKSLVDRGIKQSKKTKKR